MTDEKVLTLPPTASGSAEYIVSRKYDVITKSLQKDIKEHETSKKLLILSYAKKFEAAGYPVNNICHRISRDLSGPEYEASASYVRKVLPAKYKDLEQQEVALMQNSQSSHAGATHYRQQEQVSKKDIKEVTLEDIKFLSPRKAKQVAKHSMEKAMWWEQQAKQKQEGQQVPTTNKQDPDADMLRATLMRMNKTMETLKEKNDALKDGLKYARGIISEVLDKKTEEKYIVARVRSKARLWLKEYEKYVGKAKTKPKPKVGKMGKQKEKMALLNDVLAYRNQLNTEAGLSP